MSRYLLRSLLVGVLCSTSVLSAQSTWNGLQFGMSIEDVHKSLPSFDLKPAEGRVGTYLLTPPYALALPGAVKSATFSVEVQFAEGGLSLIRLKLDHGNAVNGDIADPMMLLAFLPKELETALSTKYGQPVHLQGQCSPSFEDRMKPNNVLSCEQAWGDKGQKVTSFWTYRSTPSFLYQIEYRPQMAGL